MLESESIAVQCCANALLPCLGRASVAREFYFDRRCHGLVVVIGRAALIVDGGLVSVDSEGSQGMYCVVHSGDVV